MTREVYTDQKFIKFSRSQVFVRVFQDTEPEGARLASKYAGLGIPHADYPGLQGPGGRSHLGAMRAEDLIKELQLIFESARSERK